MYKKSYFVYFEQTNFQFCLFFPIKNSLVSISSAFHDQLFCTKVLYAAFLQFQFGFENFWRKQIFTKSACKMFVKLTLGANFINILHPHFSYKILKPKIAKLNITTEKLLNLLTYEKRVRKMLIKLTLNVNFMNILHTAVCVHRAQKRKFVSLFMLSGSAHAKAAHKYVGEIYPRSRELIVSKDSLQTFFSTPTSQYNNSFTEKNRLCIFLCKINRINCIQNYICISYKVTCSELMFAISNFNLKKLIFLNSL